MKAKIYQPAKSATQSAKSDFWLLEFSSQDKPIIDDKMLWTSSSNTQDKVKIRFSDKDKAIKFAEKNNIDLKQKKQSTTNLASKRPIQNATETLDIEPLDEQNLVQDNKKSEKFEIDDPW